MEDVRAEALREAPTAQVFVQAERSAAPADAVLAAREALAQHKGDVLVLYADTPLLTTDDAAAGDGAASIEGAGIAVLGFEAADPTGYGRLLTDPGGWLMAIREERDASESERRVRLCNSGVMAFRLDDLLGVLGRIGNANAKGEFYLTDAVEIARQGRRARRSRRLRGGGGAGRQLARAARRGGSDLPDARAPERHARGRHADRAGDGLAHLRHQARPRRHHRAQRVLRAGRERGGRRRDQGQLPLSSMRASGTGARVGPFARLRPGADLGAARARRQLRRGQELDAGRGRQGQSPVLHRRRRRRRRRQHRGRHNLLQLRRLQQASHR